MVKDHLLTSFVVIQEMHERQLAKGDVCCCLVNGKSKTT